MKTFKLRSYVFWTLLTVEISSFAKCELQWKYLQEITFDSGDIIQTKDKGYLVTEDQNNFFYLEIVNDLQVTVKKSYKQQPSWSKIYAAKYSMPPDFVKTRGWRLAKRLLERKLPLSEGCSTLHYVDYIMLGYTRSPWLPRSRGPLDNSCPLNRDLTSLRIEDINSPGLYLEDKTGNRYFVTNIRKIRDPGPQWYEGQPSRFTERSISKSHSSQIDRVLRQVSSSSGNLAPIGKGSNQRDQTLSRINSSLRAPLGKDNGSNGSSLRKWSTSSSHPGPPSKISSSGSSRRLYTTSSNQLDPVLSWYGSTAHQVPVGKEYNPNRSYSGSWSRSRSLSSSPNERTPMLGSASESSGGFFSKLCGGIFSRGKSDRRKTHYNTLN